MKNSDVCEEYQMLMIFRVESTQKHHLLVNIMPCVLCNLLKLMTYTSSI